MKQIFASTTKTFKPMTGEGPFQTSLANEGQLGTTLEIFFSIFLGVFTIIGALAFIIYFLIGAFNYLTAQGSPEKLSKAQNALSSALIGLILVVMAWSIAGLVSLVLGFNILDLAGMIGRLTP